MKALLIAGGVAVGCMLLGTIILVLGVSSTLDAEAQGRNGIVAQEGVQEAAYDKLWKKIASEVKITKASSELQKELVANLIMGRGAAFVKVVNESNPDAAFTREQFTRLSNVIEAERDGLFREQRVLLSKVEQYNNGFDRVFSGTILSFAGRHRYPTPMIITSDKAKAARESGVDNSIDLEL